MAQISAGLLMYRKPQAPEFFLVHPGGPYFKNKDLGSWSIPKGLVQSEEPLLEAACREFFEETGIMACEPFYQLGSIKQKSGKVVYAWAFLGTWQASDGFISNTFSIEWPPRSGKMQSFPEADQACWLTLEEARVKILAAQSPFLDRALKLIESP